LWWRKSLWWRNWFVVAAQIVVAAQLVFSGAFGRLVRHCALDNCWVLTAMHRVANGLFATVWTAGVTLTYVAKAKFSGDYKHVAHGQRVWARGLLNTWGVEIETHGTENAPPHGPYIIMANHQSHADVPILFASLPHIPGFLAKRELARIPFLAMALRSGDHVLIDRKGHKSAMRALKDAALEIQGGKIIAVFPEGTRGESDHLGDFKKGGFLIAKKAAVPIVPVGILGSRKLLSRRELFPRGGQVTVNVGPVIGPEQIKELTVEGLSERVRSAMNALLGWSD
jgi:1-acyl-sn-glycerol-3-phosphate acyltransferase